MSKCKICGCTDNHACKGGCFWVDDDLCSACVVGKKIKRHGSNHAMRITDHGYLGNDQYGFIINNHHSLTLEDLLVDFEIVGE